MLCCCDWLIIDDIIGNIDNEDLVCFVCYVGECECCVDVCVCG